LSRIANSAANRFSTMIGAKPSSGSSSKRPNAHRAGHGPDRAARRQRQVGAAGDGNLAGGHQRQGRAFGPPVGFVVYDDQSNPSTVPGMHTKLLDVDKVDLIVSGYGTTSLRRRCR
jgi:hypothetical protein